jgi:hypothetical protein
VTSALVVAACAVPVGAAVAAETTTSPNPEPLWEAYPLDGGSGAAAQSRDTTGTGSGTAAQSGAGASGAAASSGERARAATPLASTDEAGDAPPWLLMVAAAAGGALFVTLVLLLQGRRARKRDAELGRVATPDEWPWLKAGHTNGTDEFKAERLPPPARVFEVAEAREVPRRRFEREPEPKPAPAPDGRPAAARRGPICQVRWSPDEARFYAATPEERIAQSPTFDWPGDGPPDEESREARTALRVLSKELRDKGWRPMRVKGSDFDEQRWYARRFRLPVADGDDVSSPQSDSAHA